MTVAQKSAAGIVRAHFTASCDAAAAFFQPEAPAIAAACEELAGRFSRGGTLLVAGIGPHASDAQHVSVEFVHPIVVGKRALPAVALTSDAATLTASGSDEPSEMFAAPLRALARPQDVLFALCGTNIPAPIRGALDAARRRDVRTFLFSAGHASGTADIVFTVPNRDPLIVQEVHETLYHVLWELVHVFLEHEAAPSDADAFPTTPPDLERALYPFLFDHSSHVLEGTRIAVRESILAKCEDICTLRHAVSNDLADGIAEAGRAIAGCAARGGRVLAFGNGGSATDAQDAAADCMAPQKPGWRTIPALALTNDTGVLTAVANDVGFDHAFARQILAFGAPGDIALGISTSGSSPSILAAFEAARSRGMKTIALSGNDGGAVARSAAVDTCLTAPSAYTPRIQEAHATIWHAMLTVAQQEGLPA